ncbi:MAG: hypothetical protein NW241_02900 [Bacteroidia bacterium]|nr:hypothetical protein [Bacteroidia bacterium]
MLFPDYTCMHSEFLTFRRYSSREEADSLVALLRHHGIDCRIEDHSPAFDGTITGGSVLQAQVELKIPSDAFSEADALLREDAALTWITIPDDHYLHAFSDEELVELLHEQDKWSADDALLARRLLLDRGIVVTATELDDWQAWRYAILERPERMPLPALMAGLLLLMLAAGAGIAFRLPLFGVLGAFACGLMGTYYAILRRTLPDGRRVRVYDRFSRRAGILLTAASLAAGAASLGAMLR